MLLPGITLTTKGEEDIYPIESLQLYQFDGEAYQPLGDVVSYEAKTPRFEPTKGEGAECRDPKPRHGRGSVRAIKLHGEHEWQSVDTNS